MSYQATSHSTDTPRVWIGCLAAYNGGDLHGRWVDADDVDELERVRAEIIRTSPAWRRGEHAEEHAIMDYEGFGPLRGMLGEWASFEIVAAVAQAIERHGPAFIGYVDACERALDQDVASQFAEAYQGEWDSERDYAEHYIGEVGLAGVDRIPDELLRYLDMETITDEIFRYGTMTGRGNPDGGIYVYDTRI
jgi:antirestriction protein